MPGVLLLLRDKRRINDCLKIRELPWNDTGAVGERDFSQLLWYNRCIFYLLVLLLAVKIRGQYLFLLYTPLQFSAAYYIYSTFRADE